MPGPLGYSGGGGRVSHSFSCMWRWMKFPKLLWFFFGSGTKPKNLCFPASPCVNAPRPSRDRKQELQTSSGLSLAVALWMNKVSLGRWTSPLAQEADAHAVRSPKSIPKPGQRRVPSGFHTHALTSTESDFSVFFHGVLIGTPVMLALHCKWH